MNSNTSTLGSTSRLGGMMFLEFFIWGAWYVSVGNFMTKQGMADWVGWAYTVGPIAAVISPFFLGLVADRYFATERVLGVMHLLGAAAMVCAPLAAQRGPELFIAVLLLHMLCYMPTLGLTNTLAFHNVQSQEKQFPVIRVFGTIGWIAANRTVSNILGADFNEQQFYLTAAAGAALGLYSFTLPHTPPPGKGKPVSIREVLGLDALSMMKDRSFAVFVIASFLICIPLAAYYAFAPIYAGQVGYENVAGVMSWGQMSEIIFMLLMPVFFVRLGVKNMLLLGMLAWVIRYGLFAGASGGISGAAEGLASPMNMVFLGILLHGICYDFFFVSGFIYTDKKAPHDVRGQAQGFLVLVTQGLGLGLGAVIMQQIVNSYTSADGIRDWQNIWLIPCIAAAVVMVGFFLLFWDKTRADETPTV